MVKRWQLWVFALLAVAVLGGAGDWVSDALFAPWAFAAPPLLDRWSGRMVTGDGATVDVHVTLRRARVQTEDGRCARCAQIEGEAVLCRPGDLRRYRVSGSPRDRHATRLHLGALPDGPPPDGLELDTLSGTWDGADALDVDADFVRRQDGHAVSDPSDRATQPVALRLHRGSASASACPTA